MLLMGCATVYKPKERIGSTPQYTEKIVYLDPALRQSLLVANHVSKLSQDNTHILYVSASFENIRRVGIWADIQIVFYDENNEETERSNWQPEYFDPQVVRQVKWNALNNRANSYSIIIRKPRVNVHF